jgi:hypothetical protein
MENFLSREQLVPRVKMELKKSRKERGEKRQAG